MMLRKTLHVAEGLFRSAPYIKVDLEENWPPFCEFLKQLHFNLKRGPHPEFGDPIIDAFQWGFSSAAEATLLTILEKQRFDYRFITGPKRRFKALKAGSDLDNELLVLWNQVLELSTKWITKEEKK